MKAQEKDKTYIDTTAINVNVTHAGAGTDDAEWAQLFLDAC